MNTVEERVEAVRDRIDSPALQPREKKILELYYGIGSRGEQVETSSLEQIGTFLGVTRERVRQIRNHALGKIGIDLEQ